jgi:hypothetical protein
VDDVPERSPASIEEEGLGEREAKDVGEGGRRRSSSNRRCAARAARLDLCSWEGTSLALLRDGVNGSGGGGLERQRRRRLGASALMGAAPPARKREGGGAFRFHVGPTCLGVFSGLLPC